MSYGPEEELADLNKRHTGLYEEIDEIECRMESLRTKIAEKGIRGEGGSKCPR